MIPKRITFHKVVEYTKLLLLDFDGTLYSNGAGISKMFDMRIGDYVSELMGIPHEAAFVVQKSLFDHYGSTFKGLAYIGWNLDFDEYQKFIYSGWDFSEIVDEKEYEEVAQLLSRLGDDVKPVVFSNSRRSYCLEALNHLNIADFFEEVICIDDLNSNGNENDLIKSEIKQTEELEEELNLLCKPNVDAYEKAIEIVNESLVVDMTSEKYDIYFVDDEPSNIETGKEMGWTCVHILDIVPRDETRKVDADFVLENIYGLDKVLPELFKS